MLFFTQIYLLIWKNFTLHLRNPWIALGEILLPSLFAMILLLLKHTSKLTHKESTIYNTEVLMWPNFTVRLGYIPLSSTARKITEWVLETELQNLMMMAQAREDLNLNATRMYKKGEAIGFKDFDEGFRYFRKRTSVLTFIIEFHGINETTTELPRDQTVIIHPYRKALNTWSTERTHMFEFQEGPRPNLIMDYQMAYIQSLVCKGILAHWLALENKDTQAANFPLYIKRFPHKDYYEDGMFFTVKLQLTLFMVLGFMMSVFVDTKNIVHEKEERIKETMKLMGMGLPAFWISWFITCLMYLVPAFIFYAVILGMDITGKGPILQKSDITLVLAIILCYCLAIITFSFMISCLVQKGNDGAIAAGLLFLCEYVPYEIISHKYSDFTKVSKSFFCLFFNIALGLCNYNLARREARGEGLQWNNYQLPIGDDDFTVKDSMLIMLLDSAIHIVLTWYLDNVFPGDFGVPKPPFFFFKKSYWGLHTHIHDMAHLDKTVELDSKFYEDEPANLNAGVRIVNLRKEFGDKVSVRDLCLNMYEGQITVLLGHNGAGKTTTMNMLTGFIPPTKGTAFINGYDICKNIVAVRKSLGMCPQHDILFDNLTCKEHLWFFSKGYQSENLLHEVKDMIKEIGLESKSHVVSRKLSAGEKRSLSVGIALMGDSKVVFLDEPSSGMDPSTRRHTWDVLQRNRPGRTMLLSTHYMDEADALGDRIAIMAEGHTQCCGTPLFLKKLYGTGYHLVIIKENTCNIETLTRFIKEFVPFTQIESIINMEITYLLPESDTSTFPLLFRELNASKKLLHIISFGTSATTMEEVFLKSEEDNKHSIESTSVTRSISKTTSFKSVDEDVNLLEFNSGFQLIKGLSLKMNQLTALIAKRYIVSKKHWLTTLVSYCLPSSMFLLYILFDYSIISVNRKDDPLLMFNLSMYGDTSVPIVYDNASRKLIQVYKSMLGNAKVIDLTELKDTTLDNFLLKNVYDIGPVNFEKEFVVGVNFSYDATLKTITPVALFNGQPYHSLFVSVDLVIKTMVHVLLDKTYNITVGILPIPFKGESELEYAMFESFRSGFFAGMFAGIGMAMYSACVVHFILRERESGVKHMQAIFGVSMFMYWFPTFLWDALSFIIPTIFLFIIFFLFDQQAFFYGINWILVIIVICAFIWAILPIIYALQFCFEAPSSGLAGVLILNLLSVLFSDVIVFEFGKPRSDNNHIGKALKFVFTVFFPCFNLSQCFSFILKNFKAEMECEPYQEDCMLGIPSLCCIKHPDLCYSLNPDGKCFPWTETPLAFDHDRGIGIYLVFMIVQGFLGCIAVFVIECGFITKIYFMMCKKHPKGNPTESPDLADEEDDVVAERNLILSSPIEKLSQQFPVILVEVHKRYADFNAVDHITVGVPEKECFGLLGQSGAGKTTIFRMLTGETAVTGGDAYVKGFDVRTDLRTVQSLLGYCPQFDAHIEELSARDTLIMYARLRGIPEKNIHTVVENLIDVVLLKPHADNMCGTYSGGNKRKLSLAMALVGDPPCILLDEPSTGMDPKARRQMWNILSKIRACGRTIIFSSHSMEECDALCTRLAIMLRGRFTCIGSPQHLKSKFGQGYTLIIKMGHLPEGPQAPTDPVVEYIQSLVPDTTVFDDHQGYVHLQINDTSIEVADVFSLMEQCKDSYFVQDYSVHETTLEQIFLTFTKLQKLDDEERIESCLFLRAGFFNENLCY
ncbi:phospholipid-transporting ATPase ABCA3-like isoform X2 [Biomphalaria glabrata]|uniref:Phospholipid-transporting ATPase ABCA3-like isoform X2 n=1 Tax=Biomphalaria glabrata TaxID=6526 RepID=A0A9W3B3A6_BIOGL|nr:phospholipid-transporting ATPase ABCA3-like isoform X2 [Biomphalaria glabrata]